MSICDSIKDTVYLTLSMNDSINDTHCLSMTASMKLLKYNYIIIRDINNYYIKPIIIFLFIFYLF